MPDIDLFNVRALRVARMLGFAFLISAVALLGYVLISGGSDDFTIAQLCYVTVVAGASLLISRAGRVSLGVTVLVVGIEILLVVEPYFLLHRIPELTVYLFISMMTLMILIAVSALYLNRFVTLSSLVVTGTTATLAMYLSRDPRLLDGIPYVIAAVAIGTVVIWYLQTVNERTRRLAEREAAGARRAADEANARLEERTTLLREVYHRVKNNLQVVISLLSLQAGRTSDPEARNALQAVGGRVSAMALVHQTLHNSSTLSSVDARSFIEGLVGAVEELHAELRQVETTLSIDPVMLDISKLVSLGLIINELGSNAYEHAFNEGAPGKIDIRLRDKGDGTAIVTFADNGSGFPKRFDPSTASSLGMTLVYQLTQQLSGTISVQTVPEVSGTVWTLTLPL